MHVHLCYTHIVAVSSAHALPCASPSNSHFSGLVSGSGIENKNRCFAKNVQSALPVLAFRGLPELSRKMSAGYTNHWFAPVDTHGTSGGEDTTARSSV